MKKLLVILLSVLCLFSLTACNSSNSDIYKEGNVVIKLGGSGPLEGDAAQYGQAVYNAAKIAVDEINKSDSKIKFDFKMENDDHDPEKAVSAYATLYDWGMQVSLFTVTSGPGAAVAKNYDDDKIFALTPSGSAVDLVYSDSKNYEGNFQMCFTDPNQGKASAEYIAENFKDAKVAIIYKSDDVYSAGVYNKFIEVASTLGINIVTEEKQRAFTSETEKDFTTLLAAAKAAGADLIYIPIYYQPASTILQQTKDMDYAPKFFGVDGLDGLLDLDGFKKELAEGVYLLTPFAANAKDEKTSNFVKAYKEKYNETPNQFAADAYDAVYAIHQALNKIGVDENYNYDNLYKDMISQFTSMKFDGVTGTGINWSTNGEVSKNPICVVIKDGNYVVVE